MDRILVGMTTKADRLLVAGLVDLQPVFSSTRRQSGCETAVLSIDSAFRTGLDHLRSAARRLVRS